MQTIQQQKKAKRKVANPVKTWGIVAADGNLFLGVYRTRSSANHWKTESERVARVLITEIIK